MGTGLRAPRHRVQQVGRRVRTSTWDLPGIVEGPEGPADDLHRIGCGTVESPLYGWTDYSPTKHSAQGTIVLRLMVTVVSCFVAHTLSRSISLSFIHIFIFTSNSSSSLPSPLLTRGDSVASVPCVASSAALLTSPWAYYLTASLFQPSPNQVSRLLAKSPYPCLSLTIPRHSFPHQRRGQTTRPRLGLTR